MHARHLQRAPVAREQDEIRGEEQYPTPSCAEYKPARGLKVEHGACSGGGGERRAWPGSRQGQRGKREIAERRVKETDDQEA